MKKIIFSLILMLLVLIPVCASAEIPDGWVTDDSGTYYYENGEFLKGMSSITVDQNTKVYYFDEITGVMQYGFIDVADKRYYFSKKDGHMLKGFWTIGDGKYYFSKKDGHMLKGFQTINGSRYYFSKTTGKRFHGWHTINGHKYYMGSKTGKIYKGMHKIGKNVYTFNSKGVLKRTVYGSRKAVALTYDDGPSGNTTTILNTLKEYNGLATFFVVGNRIGSYKSAVKNADSMGCQIANHSWSHPWYWQMSSSDVKSQIQKCNSKVKEVTGKIPTVCRTPGGDTTSFVKKAVGMPIILWSIDTRDWESQNATKVYNAVMNNVSDGDIVLMHDLYSSTASASKRIIPALSKRGYQMVTIEEMRLLKGKKLKSGYVYYSFK